MSDETRDSNGAILNDGDNVTVIKDLKVKGKDLKVKDKDLKVRDLVKIL